MPLPYNPEIIENAVSSALEKSGVLSKRNSAIESLNEAGADVERLAHEIANLVFSAKESTKLKAIQYAFALHGINIQAESTPPINPTINIMVQGEDIQLKNLFAPERNF